MSEDTAPSMTSALNSGDEIQFPWPCPRCGDGHERRRTYYLMPDWFVCACGADPLPREHVPELGTRWEADHGAA